MRGRALILAVLAAATLLTLTYGGQSLARVWQMKHEVESLEREIVTLRAEAGRLTATVNRLRTDPDFIEQVAREDLGLVKPGRAGPQAAAVPGAERALARVDIIPLLFFVALFFNIRASIKLALDWRGMLITTRFVRDAYARLADLPTEERARAGAGRAGVPAPGARLPRARASR